MNWQKSDLSDVKEGDVLFSAHFGWCKVIAVASDERAYVITICGKAGRGTYTIDGKETMMDLYPTLWKQCPYNPPVPKAVERPNFEVDHPVYVRSAETDNWMRRHFCRWPRDGESPGILVFSDGKTSFTLGTSVFFKFWKDAKDD